MKEYILQLILWHLWSDDSGCVTEACEINTEKHMSNTILNNNWLFTTEESYLCVWCVCICPEDKRPVSSPSHSSDLQVWGLQGVGRRWSSRPDRFHHSPALCRRSSHSLCRWPSGHHLPITMTHSWTHGKDHSNYTIQTGCVSFHRGLFVWLWTC